jgi:hypothetical protein
MNGTRIPTPTRSSSAIPGALVAGGLWLLLMELPKFL